MSRKPPAPPEPVGLAGPGQSEFILYQIEDGLARVEVRLHEGSVWLTQKQLADLYQIKVPTVSQHLRNIFAEGELDPAATVRQFLTVRTEGNRSISRTLEHYGLHIVLAIGYRVQSTRGTQFRQWATTRLAEYAVKGFVLDDEQFFATVQNKMHFAAHGQTAAEVIAARADATQG